MVFPFQQIMDEMQCYCLDLSVHRFQLTLGVALTGMFVIIFSIKVLALTLRLGKHWKRSRCRNSQDASPSCRNKSPASETGPDPAPPINLTPNPKPLIASLQYARQQTHSSNQKHTYLSTPRLRLHPSRKSQIRSDSTSCRSWYLEIAAMSLCKFWLWQFLNLIYITAVHNSRRFLIPVIIKNLNVQNGIKKSLALSSIPQNSDRYKSRIMNRSR